MYRLRECDGSCLVNQKKAETIAFEDGTRLSLYWCWHERCYVLTDYFPPERRLKYRKKYVKGNP